MTARGPHDQLARADHVRGTREPLKARAASSAALGATARDPFREFSAGPFGSSSFFAHQDPIMRQFSDMSRIFDSFSPLQLAVGSAAGGSPTGARGGLGGDQYVCQTFAVSSMRGPDGKTHTEKFSSSDVGNRTRGIRESQQMYSNSTTGVDKMGLERHLGERARKVVRERQQGVGDERCKEMLRGMDESGKGAFDRDFAANARHLPPHPKPLTKSALSGRGSFGEGSRKDRSAVADDASSCAGSTITESTYYGGSTLGQMRTGNRTGCGARSDAGSSMVSTYRMHFQPPER